MALMNNFDFYLENLDTAKNSTGALNEQQKIYKESWKAANKEVQASMEAIWNNLINDESFIKITHLFADFLTLIDKVIDSLGGLKGVLLLIGSIATKVFASEMSAGLASFGKRLKTITPGGKRAVIDEQFNEKREANASLRTQHAANDFQYQVNNIEADVYDAYIDKTSELIKQGQVLSKQEADRKDILIDQLKIQGDQVVKEAELAEKQNAIAASEKLSLRAKAGKDSNKKKVSKVANTGFELGVQGAYADRLMKMKDNPVTANSYEEEKKYLEAQSKKAVDKLGLRDKKGNLKLKGEKINNLNDVDVSNWSAEEKAALAYLKVLKEVIASEKERRQSGEKDTVEDIVTDVEGVVENTVDRQNQNKENVLKNSPNISGDEIENLDQSFQTAGAGVAKTTNALNNFNGAAKEALKHADGMNGKAPSLGDSFVALRDVIMSVSLAFESLKSIFDVWNDEDASFGDKLITTFSSLAFVIPIVTSAFNKQNLSQLTVIASAIGSILPMHTLSAAEAQAGIAAAAASGSIGAMAAALWAALWPIALVAAAIVALVAVVYLLVKKSKEQYEQAKKNAEQAQKNNEKLKEQRDKARELKDAVAALTEEYNKNKAAGEELAGTYSELISKMQQLKEAYSSMNISDATKEMLAQGFAIGQATGDWSEWNKAVEQADKEADEVVAESDAATMEAEFEYAKQDAKQGKKTSAEAVDLEVEQEKKDYEKRKAEYEQEKKEYEESEERQAYKEYEEKKQERRKTRAFAARNNTVAGPAWDLPAQEADAEIALEEALIEYNQALSDFTKKENPNSLDLAALNQALVKLNNAKLDLENIQKRSPFDSTQREEFKNRDNEFKRMGVVLEEEGKKYEQNTKEIGLALDENASPGEFVRSYEEMEQYAQELYNQGYREDYETLQSILEDNKEHYDKMKSYFDSASNNYASSALKGAGINPNKGTFTRKNYQEAINAIVENEDFLDLYGDEELAIKGAKDYLARFENAQGAISAQNWLDKWNEHVADARKEVENFVPDDSFPLNSVNIDELKNLWLSALDMESRIDALTPDQQRALSFMNPDAIDIDFSSEGWGYAIEDQLNQQFQDAWNRLVDFDVNSLLTEAAGQYDFDEDYLTSLGDALLEMSREGEEGYELLKDNADLAAQTTVDYARLNRGILDLSESYGDYVTTLKNVQDASSKVDKAAILNSESGKKLKSTLSDILGVSDDLVDADFLDNINMDDFKGAAYGNEKSLQNIRQQFGRTQAIKIEAEGDFDSFWEAVSNTPDGVTIDITGDASKFTAALMEAQLAAGKTTEDIKQLFSGMGINLDIQQMEGTLEEAQAAASEAGAAIVNATGVTVTPETETEEVKASSPPLVSSAESVSVFSHTADYEILENEGGGTVSGKAIFPAFTKSVNATISEIDGTGEVSTTSYKAENGEGVTSGGAESSTPSSKGSQSPTVKPLGTTTASPSGSIEDGGTQRRASNQGTSQKGTYLLATLSKKSPAATVPSTATRNEAQRNMNGGGGGTGPTGSPSSPKYAQVRKPIEEKDLEEEIERYHEINQLIEDQEKLLERLGKRKETTYGPDKLRAIQKEIDANKILIKQNKQLLEEARENLASDRATLEEYGVTFDDEGRINNYDEIIAEKAAEWHEARQAAEDALYEYDVRAAATEDYDPEGREKLALEMAAEAVDNEYDAFQGAISLYEDSYKQVREALDKDEDLMRTIWEENYEKVTVKLEFKLKLDEKNISDIQAQLQRISDNDFARSAEKMALITKESGYYFSEAQNQMEAFQEAAEKYQKTLEGDVLNGISQANFHAILDESIEKIGNLEQSARDGIEKITEALNGQFSLMYEKVNRVFEKISRRLDFAEFYEDIIKSIYGETQDYYEALFPMINSHIKLIDTELDGLIAYRDQLAAVQTNLIAQLEDENTPEEIKERVKNTLYGVEAEIASLNSNIQSDIQSRMELVRKEFEASIEEISKTWQRQYFGGKLIDEVLDEIELREQAQEELLTKTNQVYETNKLIRQAESDILKTTNKRAKQAYQEYIYKVEQQQEQNKLTQLELDLLTAEYEITKAQIALEEAKNAKDTVRLTRDSEGNFGYVYTANQDNISNAEQALEDATNNYYNIALEGAKSSTEEIYQLEADLLEKLIKINLDESLSEEQKQQKIAEIRDHYNSLITQQRDKFYIAKEAVEESSYSHKLDYDLKEIESAENWFENIDKLLNKMEEASKGYQIKLDDVSEYVKQAYNKQETAVETVDKATAIYGIDLEKLIPTLSGSFVSAIDAATGAWERQLGILEKIVAMNNELQGISYNLGEKETYSEDYAARIKTLIEGNYQYEDYEIQKLLEWRWEKLGGVDNTDYQALMNELEKQGLKDSVEYKLYEMLRRYKIEHTDISATDWDDDKKTSIREEEKLGQDFHQLIDNYLKSSKASWYDKAVQDWLVLQQRKIDERGLAGKVESNKDLEEYFKKKYPEKFKISIYTNNDWSSKDYESIYNRSSAEETVTKKEAVPVKKIEYEELSDTIDEQVEGYVSKNHSTGTTRYSGSTIDYEALKQNIVIYADFPGVTNGQEIERAFYQLATSAAQKVSE